MNAMRFDVAQPEDDAQLRDVLAATPMDGHVRVSFRREPNFFAASVVEGPFRQTLVARDGDLIAGIGCRSIRSRYVNGVPMPIGYLSGLRLRLPIAAAVCWDVAIGTCIHYTATAAHRFI